MIDLTNKPEGATHYCAGNGLFYKYVSGLKYAYTGAMGGWSFSDSTNILMEIIAKEVEWTIYNNTMPLSELSDEQRGLLFNHHCNGGQLQNSQHGGSEIDVFYDTDSWSIWSLNTIYRAKQKSERELFVDAAFNTCPVFTDTKYDHEQLLNSMFDAGFKAPKVGE